MPPVDLESLVAVCGGGNDRKIACEPLANDHDETAPQDTADVEAVEQPDFPPESFWLSKDAEFDWFDRNAFLERKESTKGNFNSANLNPNVNPHHSNSNSQRFSTSLKSKVTGILGLPKTQKTAYGVDPKQRRNCKAPANVRLFPKRSDSVGKTTAGSVTEPSSPKVSCIGRVRSRRCKYYKKPSSSSVSESNKPAGEPERSGKSRKKTGLMSRITSLFRQDGSHRRRKNDKKSPDRQSREESAPRKTAVGIDEKERESPVKADPPALGGMARFASGRRSESWSGVEDIDMERRDSLNLERRGV